MRKYLFPVFLFLLIASIERAWCHVDTSEAEKAGSFSPEAVEAEKQAAKQKRDAVAATDVRYRDDLNKIFLKPGMDPEGPVKGVIQTHVNLLSDLSPRVQEAAFKSMATGQERFPPEATPKEVTQIVDYFARVNGLRGNFSFPDPDPASGGEGGFFEDIETAIGSANTKERERSAIKITDPLDRALSRIPPKAMERAVKASPKNPRLNYGAGLLRERTGDPSGAADFFQAAINNGQRDPKTYTALARTAFAAGRLEKAHEAARGALEKNPSPELRRVAQSYFELSKDRLSSGGSALKTPKGKSVSDPSGIPIGSDFGDAADRALDPRSRRSHALMKEARRALTIGSEEDAVALATRALELNPDNARALNLRSAAFQRLGRHQEALDDAESVVALVPGNGTGLLSRALSKAELGRFDEALEDARAVLAVNPQSIPALRIAAFAQAGLGSREGMLETLKEGAALNPTLAHIYQRALELPEGDDLLLLFGDETIVGKEPLSPVTDGLPWLPVAGIGALLFLGSALRRRKKEPPVEAAEAPSLLPAGFDLVGTLGSGGMGVVYKARDRGTQRFVAVKRLREEIRGDARAVDRVLKEARAVARLKHPNVVSVYGVRRHRGEVFLIFEYVEGQTFSELLGESDRRELPEAISLVVQACAAVDHAHSHSVVHRDIKPSNLMIDTDGNVRVMDFGIARLATDAMTRTAGTGTVAGTPPYMAPEQEEGKSRRESDIFSLGVLFYELVTGELPFPGLGAALHLQKREGRFVPPSQRVPEGLPAELDAVIAKAIAPEPADRFSSAGEFAAALKGLLPA